MGAPFTFFMGEARHPLAFRDTSHAGAALAGVLLLSYGLVLPQSRFPEPSLPYRGSSGNCPCSYLSLRANMFEEQQGATWLEHSPDLAQTALWITHGTEDERHYRTVEMCIWERERLDRSAFKSDGNGSILQDSPCRGKHRLVRLNRLHTHHASLLVEGEVLTPAGTDFKHDPVCLPGGLTPQGIEHPPDESLPHQPIVKKVAKRG